MAGFRNLTDVSHPELRVGMRFLGETGVALDNALRDAVATIARMPATYTTYPNGGPILPARRSARARRPSAVLLDRAYLSSFGELFMPRHLWNALQRFDAWIEPALVAEWSRLVRLYADRQGQRVDEAILAAAMVWDEPTRDVVIARQQAIKLLNGKRLFCVWSGKRLTDESLDVDHCFPWSACPCGDLWNLLPAHRIVNRQEERDCPATASSELQRRG